MPRRIEKRERGVYEKEPGSDIWWIRQKVDGTFHREKVGHRGDAIKLYKVRSTDRDGGTILGGDCLRFSGMSQSICPSKDNLVAF